MTWHCCQINTCNNTREETQGCSRGLQSTPDLKDPKYPVVITYSRPLQTCQDHRRDCWSLKFLTRVTACVAPRRSIR